MELREHRTCSCIAVHNINWFAQNTCILSDIIGTCLSSNGTSYTMAGVHRELSQNSSDSLHTLDAIEGELNEINQIVCKFTTLKQESASWNCSQYATEIHGALVCGKINTLCYCLSCMCSEYSTVYSLWGGFDGVANTLLVWFNSWDSHLLSTGSSWKATGKTG